MQAAQPSAVHTGQAAFTIAHSADLLRLQTFYGDLRSIEFLPAQENTADIRTLLATDVVGNIDCDEGSHGCIHTRYWREACVNAANTCLSMSKVQHTTSIHSLLAVPLISGCAL